MKRLLSHLRRIGAFAGKEIKEIWRQPRLVLTLIVGPFFILGLFALGFEARPPALQTVLVMPSDSELADRSQEFEDALEPFIEVVEVSQDEAGSVLRLHDREIDLVIVAPSDAAEEIRNGRHATIEVYHTKLDPFDQANIVIFARASIDELNRALLAEVARVGQERVEQNDEALPAARDAARAYTEAVRSGDDVEARRAQLELDRALLVLDRQLASSTQIYEGLDRGLGAGEGSALDVTSQLRSSLVDVDHSDPEAEIAALAVENELEALETALAEFTRIPPEVAVQPFVPQSTLVNGVETSMASFYAPAVMVVLIQHLAVTFAALSIVREHSLGSVELLRMGPATVTDVLLGKYLGYTLIAGSLAAGLVAVLVLVLGVPMQGSWLWLAILLSMLTIASFAFGFLIAAFSRSDTQAVQFSMLALLFTIFFSGLVLPLDRITEAVRGLAFLVPATAGNGGIQDVMLRGDPPRLSMVLALGGYLVVVFAVSTMLLRRQFRT